MLNTQLTVVSSAILYGKNFKNTNDEKKRKWKVTPPLDESLSSLKLYSHALLLT
jgi:hypothetical protein